MSASHTRFDARSKSDVDTHFQMSKPSPAAGRQS
jgi:hypothetical protein